MRHSRGVADTLTAQIGMWATPDTARRGTETPEKRAARQKISGGGCSNLLVQAEYWPTPDAMVANDRETPDTWRARAAALKVKHGNGNGAGMPLTIAATAWPTPMASDDGDKVSPASHQNQLTVMVREWPTPNARDHKGADLASREGGSSLSHVVERSLPQDLPTSDGEESSTAPRTLRRRLNPAFVCSLMGWPWWWTRADPISFGAAGTALWRSRLQQHLCFLLDGR
jgi:hypothetical protein